MLSYSCWLFALMLIVGAQGPGPGPGRRKDFKDKDYQMQSRAVDTRVTLEIAEGQAKGTVVGKIPTKEGFTYRFNEAPKEFSLNAESGEIKTNLVLDREGLKNDRFDLVVLSSQPTYPIEVRIVVLDVNDNSPEFPEDLIEVSFSESSVAGTRILLDAASDQDSGVNGVSEDYRIVAGNKEEKFKLAVTPNPTGETAYLHLETTGKLDRETQGFYLLNISARDGGNPPRFGYLLVNVSILDVNDNPPIFDHSDYIVSLNESVLPGTPVLTVMATDNDLGDNAKITYYLADTERQFSVDPETGEISTQEVLDCPQQNCQMTGSCPKSCVFTVFARDHGNPRQDGRTYVTVNLLDANDHDPIIRFRYFPSTAGFATVDENAGNGSVVAAVSVVDQDEGLNGETNVKIISGNELNHFRLDYTPSFDIVRVNGVLDREEISKYNLTVIATDKGNPPRSASAFLIIHVNDVNDHEPVFEKSEYSAVLSELAPPGTYAAGIKATDEDSGVNSQIFYSFVSGNYNQWFEINSESGLVTTRSVLDREVEGSVELNISARDGGPNPKWAFTQLKVTILDENDEIPKFSQEKLQVNLTENSPARTLVAMLTANDHDQGTNGSVTYSLHHSVAQRYPNTFNLDPLTGRLTTAKNLDREKISSYEILVIAKDQGQPQQSSTAQILLNISDVNDNNPEFYPKKYFLTIREDVPTGSSLLKLKAADLDEGENAMILFDFISGEQEFFNLDRWSGVLSLKKKLRNAFYKLKISAKDFGGRKAADEATIEIFKEKVVEDLEFEEDYEFQIVEDHGNKAFKEREVGRIKAKNKEGVSYFLVDGDANGNFGVEESSGRLLTKKKIDREEQSVYNLEVYARSGLGLGKTLITISILDLNDNSPEFLKDNEEITLKENAAVGQEVYLARAKDADSGINSRLTYTLSFNPEEQFKISESSGVIYLNRPVLHEPGTLLHVEVTASDSGSPKLSSKTQIFILLEDVNDHTPMFDHTSYETSLLESTPVNSRFFAISASDTDQRQNGMVTYSILDGNGEGKFGIFPDGLLYVKRGLDREEKDYYSLSLKAEDLGDPSRSSTVPIVIHIIDENDNPPEFTNSTFTFYLRENEPVDAFVGKLTATDKDIGRNSELIYSLSNTQNNFIIDPKNGFIKTLKSFDREDLVASSGKNFLSLEAIVSDNGSPRLKDKVKINVFITDVNDNAPKFLRLPYKVQISEGAPVSSQVLRLYTSDADEGLNGDVFYKISGGNDEGKFEVDEATGQITLVKSLDRETKSKYVLVVEAFDAGIYGGLSSKSEVTIEVLDENDNSPEFLDVLNEISVKENAPVNSELVKFKATDSDLGVNSEISFSLTAGNRKDAFHIDPTSGILYLHKSLDYEDLNVYHLNVTASDSGSPKLSSTVKFFVQVLDCNDNPPSFPNTAIVRQIREGIPVNTPIVTVSAEDPDSGSNGKVSYSILSQDPEDNQRHFAINAQTGVIRTLLPIDREKIDTFRLTVVATDQANPPQLRLSAEKLVTVIVEDINDNAPIFVSMNSAILPKMTGAVIMRVFARDLDSSTNGLVTYELTSGNSDVFHLHRSSGTLILKRPLNSPEARYQLQIRATDEAVQSERKSSDAYITIFTENSSPSKLLPIFQSDFFSGNVFENEAAGSSILTVSARAGNGVDVEYYVTNVTGNGAQVDRLFDIDTKLGVLSTAVELDREVGLDLYEVEVYAIVVGRGAPKTSKTKVRITVLDKNDSPPSFGDAPLVYSVSEDLGQGQVVATIVARDPDTIGRLRYSFVSGNVSQFTLDGDSGVLRLADTLDRETKDVYRLTVRASDGIQYTDTVVTVQVTDTNDNPPVFLESAYSFDIPENAARGSRIGQIRASDPDLGVNAQLTYTVISDWANDVFSLNPQTGVFTLTARLDYEEVQHYILVVQAQDAGHPALSSTLTVYCNVLDLNDNAPVFDPMSYSNEIFENVSVATSVISVSATDLDSGNNGRVEYSITAGDDEDDFRITKNGTVYTNKLLDRETRSVYNLVITATDHAAPPEKRLSSTVQATIILKDVNDMSPEFVTANETSVAENVPINTVVMAVKAVDKDEGRNGYIEYYLNDDAETKEIFSLGPVDGLLRVAGKIDRELKSSYKVKITAKDRGDPPRATPTEVFVKVLDENDNSPVFDPKQYSASIAENASIGASVLQVSATDVDEGLNGRVRYSIVDGDTNRDFSIAEDTGIIRVAKNLNYERKSKYLLKVRAEDCAGDINGDVVRSDVSEVSILVSDINDNPPTFLDSPYLAYVMENVIPPNGGYVITVQAYDADTPPFNSLVRYFIKEGDTDIFRINASTGEISLLRALDRELQSEYTLSLVAMDTGSPPLTGTGTVKIIVQDVNDNSPEFKRQSYQAKIKENSPLNAFVIQPTATDRDKGLNSKLRYSLLGDKVERFKIDSSSGRISTNSYLDREEVEVYFLTLMAQDSSSTEPRATAVNLTILVEDENDNSPSFSAEKFKIFISDKTKVGEFVFGAKAVDGDYGENSKITYQIKGRDVENFVVNRRNGVVKAARDLSKFGKNFFFKIEAADGGVDRRTAECEVEVNLKSSELFPVFESLDNEFLLQENKLEVVTKIKAISPKKGGVAIEYSIAGGNAGESLKIDKVSGEVEVVGKGLDFEESQRFEVWVEAKDNDDPPLRSVVRLAINVSDQNDNRPIFETSYNSSVYEDEVPPVLVVKVTAVDEDSGRNGEVKYRLLDDFDGSFEVDEDSGEVYTSLSLDREEVGSYELIVEAVDQGEPQLTGSSTVLVNVLDKNDNPPRFTRLFSVNVTENAELNSFVIKVTSSDLDDGPNANATYSFSENPGGKFKIDPISGNVTVVGLLDREMQDEYLLKVAAVDGAWRAETPLTITIQDQNDNAPEFEHSFYSFNFPELQPNFVFVGQVSATDRDKQGPNSIISYSLQQPSDLFSVDPASGEIFSKKSLRYKYTQMETSPENVYSLMVLATDNGKPPMSSETLVTVNIVDANNNPPKFNQEEYLSPVPEEAEEGVKLLQVKAEDNLDFGVNAEVIYEVVGGNGSRNFLVDKNSGWITLRERVYGIGKIYNLRIKAIDKGIPPQQDEVNVNLVVTGENIFSPIFTALSYQVIVPENEPIGSTILTVSAQDKDEGPNGMIRYDISAGNERKEFFVDAITGSVQILQSLDFDTVQEYHLNITARDLAFQPKKTTAMLTITLTDINDNAPIFSKDFYEGFIKENLPEESLVLKVEAEDIDSPKNAVVLYRIVAGSGKDVFTIDAKTGEITSKISFDYEEEESYDLKVQASNPDSSMVSSAQVLIHITGVNEYYPKFLQSVFHFEVSESTEIGTKIGAVQATDQDNGEDGKVFYLFVGSSNDKGFSINTETGVIKVSRDLDRETQSRVVLTVLAKNSGGIRGNDTDEAQVVISIQDGNDPPEFLQEFYEALVSEAAEVGTKILTVKAVDKDVRPQNNQFSYSIIGGNFDQSFKIDPQTGEIETVRRLDRETLNSYKLVVGAIDTGLPPQTGSAEVKIIVGDVNDNGPVFEEVVGQVLENEGVGGRVMTLSATDPDLPPNGAPFTYKVIGGRHKDFVKLDRHTGSLILTKAVDREQIPQLEILVEVEDSGTPKMKSQQLIVIKVLDQNDSPSSSRSAHVLVFSFKGEFPVGKIAEVRPNDQDITGNYQCKILEDFSDEKILSIPSSCDLFTSKINPNQGYSLNVLGNDGKHQDVTSTITLEFLIFDNSTVDNSITITITNITAQNFLTNFYRGFLDQLKNVLNNNEQILLYSLYETSRNLELTLALKSGQNYKSKNYLSTKISSKSSAISSFLQREIKVNSSPCFPNPCENEGVCSENLLVYPSTKITDSPNIVFTSPLILREFSCRCQEGFAGYSCEKKQDPCLPNPCKSGAQCRRQGYNFSCLCPSGRDGKFCEQEKGDVCSANPCQNGGSCRQSPDGSSFFCLCRLGYRGNNCDSLVDSCRPNPCLHQGICLSLKPGYKCSCAEGRYGRHCEKSTFGFSQLSYMAFPPLDSSTNDITFIFSTTKPNNLLIYNYGLYTGGRSDFVAVEILNGKAVFSFGGARTAITSVSVGGRGGNLSNGHWHKVIATRNGRVISLSVAECSEQGDVCEDCKPGDSSCYADDIGPSGTLNFNNNPVMIGGLKTADPLLERPGQVHTDDLIGCVHSITVNGRQLNLSSPLDSHAVTNSCSRKNSCKTYTDKCQGHGKCLDQWETSSCSCGGGITAPDCKKSMEAVGLNGGYFEFGVSKKHRRMQLLEGLYGGKSWGGRVGENYPEKRVSLMFRTVEEEGILLYSASNRQFSKVEVFGGKVVYTSKFDGGSVNVSSMGKFNDGNWHNLTLISHKKIVKLYLDGGKVGEDLDALGVHDYLDPYLTYVSLGGIDSNLGKPKIFLGCLTNFSINNEIQPFSGNGSIFPEVTKKGKVKLGCELGGGVGAVNAPDPLSIGITLVIVFFVVLLVAILVSFVVFRLRKQNKEKTGIPGNKTGGSGMMNSNGILNSGEVLGRNLHGNENPMTYHENGEVLRIGPELIAKKFKEREILQNELQRSQRPDIIEREVLTKNPPIREDLHPPIPPTSNHNHDHASNDLNSEVPEHYDLENASSIAPSDIDIIYHYKGYREAAGMRKYKATPPPVSGYHHKHSNAQAQSQHRHSPHHPSGFPPRAPPVTGSASRTHQSTPLARLSPSSEMSAQQPRILTLHDISGKPLQSALLATTSSSGGVGKDVLHSNSERSLNSPVMSQLSAQSSASRKVTAPQALTSEEIERLNSRPRTSSLVSTLDAVSSSSEARTKHLPHLHSPVPETHHSSSTTDESGNDSFTCSEIEYDNSSLPGEKYKQTDQERSNSSISNKNNLPPPSYDGFDSSYRGSMSTLVASDDELGGVLYRPPTGSSSTTGLGWDYLLNWGPNFESLAGVFKDIAELPDSVNGRVSSSLRLTNATKPSEEYV